MLGLLKLGAVVYVSYAFGGAPGSYVLSKVTVTPTPAQVQGAVWAGRVVSFVGLSYLVSKI